MQAVLNIDIEVEAQRDPNGLITGRILERESGLRGVLETDLFGWATEVGDGKHIRQMAARVACFNWSGQPKEVPSTLYQHIVRPEERQAMGEYYTPHWLAHHIVEALVPEPTSTRVLDPACGSGTFLEAAIEHLLSRIDTETMAPAQQMDLLQTSVLGHRPATRLRTVGEGRLGSGLCPGHSPSMGNQPAKTYLPAGLSG